MKTLCFATVMLAGLFVVVGCEPKPVDPAPKKITTEDIRRDAGQAVNTVAEYSRQTKEEFQKGLEARLKELDADIAKLQVKGRDLMDEAKVKWDQKMADLEAKRASAGAKLAEVRDSSAAAWKDLQKGAQSAWDDLDKAFHEAAREF